MEFFFFSNTVKLVDFNLPDVKEHQNLYLIQYYFLWPSFSHILNMPASAMASSTTWDNLLLYIFQDSAIVLFVLYYFKTFCMQGVFRKTKSWLTYGRHELTTWNPLNYLTIKLQIFLRMWKRQFRVVDCCHSFYLKRNINFSQNYFLIETKNKLTDY